jgi:hypothetical protein
MSYSMRADPNLEIGRILHLKSEIRNFRLDGHPAGNRRPVQSHISDFGFEMQDSSNFQFSRTAGFVRYVDIHTRSEY